MMGKVCKVSDSAYPSFIYLLWGMPAPPKFAYFVSTVTVRRMPDCVNLVVLVTQHSSFPSQRTVYKINSKMQWYFPSQSALPVKLQEWQIQPTSYESQTNLKKKKFWVVFLLS